MSQPIADLSDALAVAPPHPDDPPTATVAVPLAADAAGALASDAAAVGAWAVTLARLAGAAAARVAWLADTVTTRTIAVPARGEVTAWRATLADAAPTPGDDAASGWAPGPVTADALLASSLALVWWRTADGVEARYVTARLDRASALRLGELLVVTAASLATAAELTAVGPLAPDERARVVTTWNATARGYHPDATVHGRFRAQAALTPDAPALCDDARTLSYAALDAASDSLAERLIAAGVEADQPVALIAPRSVDAVIAALAILKAGGCYLPLDPDYPLDRLRFAIADAGVRVVVTERARGATLAALAPRTVFLDERGAASSGPIAERATATTRAYVMYTSGSTGVPKGVQIEHRSILRLVGDVGYVRLDAATRFLHAAPLGFDASTLELWGPLLHGGACVVYADLVPTGAGLAQAIARHGVTTAWLTAALFNAIVDDDPRHLAGLRQLYTGGEALSVAHVRRALAALPDTELHNGYGPTECTTFVTTYPIPRDLPADARSVPIGAPITDTRCYVLAADGAPVPIGIVGELFVGGRGVARGYLARPELDAERFVPDHLLGEGRLYRTGDRVRWRPDGTLDFVGRADQQVKLRGFRIELGEIEARLGAVPGVDACAVIVRSDGATGKRLVAYVVGHAGADVAPPTLRRALAAVLPEFMVPAIYVALPALPVTANGKLDRAALPPPDARRPTLAVPYRAPSGAREATICAVFADLLGLDQVGALDGFFELGGDSLRALALIARLREAGLPAISTATFFAAPTPAALAKAMAGAAPAARAGPPRADRRCARADRDHRHGRALPGRGRRRRRCGATCAPASSRSRVFAPHELDPSLPAAVTTDPAYVPARGVLTDAAMFDAGFFGISPLEAVADRSAAAPLPRDGVARARARGHVPERAPGPIAIFGGMYNATYYQHHLWRRPDQIRRLSELAGDARQREGLRHHPGRPQARPHRPGGQRPHRVLDVAGRHRDGDGRAAQPAAATWRWPAASRSPARRRRATCSRKARWRRPTVTPAPSTRQAGGTVFSDGVAVVVLRRLADALADGDTVYAVLLGAAVNNDGSERASFTAPSPEGQAAVIGAALDVAGVDARSISYVEAHGTATPLGDPIEIEGLTRAYRRHTADRGYCAIGSLKSNVGHMVIAAGASSLIKTALALHTRTLPPSINFVTPNPKIDFASSPFVVQHALRRGRPAPGRAAPACRRSASAAPTPTRSSRRRRRPARPPRRCGRSSWCWCRPGPRPRSPPRAPPGRVPRRRRRAADWPTSPTRCRSAAAASPTGATSSPSPPPTRPGC
jgi:amino acid adenylation domain-containing protein